MPPDMWHGTACDGVSEVLVGFVWGGLKRVDLRRGGFGDFARFGDGLELVKRKIQYLFSYKS